MSSSCSLNYPLEDQLSDPGAISNIEQSRDLLNDAYLNAFKDVGSMTLLGDDFVPNVYTSFILNETIWNWREHNINLQANHLWMKTYNSIITCNGLLSRLDKIPNNNEQDTKAINTIRMEALGLKAWNYYILIKLFGPNVFDQPNADGITIRGIDRPVVLGRSSVAKVYEHIDSLLVASSSFDKVDNTLGKQFFNSNAVLSLQMEIAADRHDWEKVLKLYQRLGITQSTMDKTSYKDLWSGEKTHSAESYFAIAQGQAVWRDLAEQTGSAALYSLFDLNPDITYSQNDNRSQSLLVPRNQRPTVGKYRSGLNDGIKIYDIQIFRTARAVLLASEASFNLNRNAEALSRLNLIRKSRGLQDLPMPSNNQVLWNEIDMEFRRELNGEWSRFFDLKRRNSPMIRWISPSGSQKQTISSSDFRWVWPIPNQEINESKGKTKQNPGWNAVV